MTGAQAGWLEELRRALAGATRVAVLGVGQELHQDDGVGMRVARLLAGRPAGVVEGGEGKGRPGKGRGGQASGAPDGLLRGGGPAPGGGGAGGEAGKTPAAPVLQAFLGGVAPENQTGAVRRFAPSHVVLVDAADLGRAPGTIEVIPAERIGGVTFSTHTLPLRFLARFLEESLGCRVVVLGIQPRDLGFGEGLSPEAEAAAREVVEGLSHFDRVGGGGNQGFSPA